MSALPESHPGIRPPRALSRPAVIAAIFLSLHLLPLFRPSNSLWGVDFLFYMPAPIRSIFVLFSILLFVPGLRRKICAWIHALPLALWGQGRSVRITRIMILLIALAAFVSLSSSRHFLGDGYLLIRILETEAWLDRPRAPLTFTVIRILHSAGAAYWETAENTYRMYSYVSGALYVLIALVAASALGKTTREKTIVLAFLFTAGYMQLFFGYVENYALYIPGLLLYLLLGMRALEDRMPPYAPAVFLGLLLALHQAFAVFGPSLLFVAYTAYRRRQGNVPVLKNALSTVAVLCLAPACGVLFTWMIGVDLDGYLGGMGGRDFLPWFTMPGPEMQYRVFSVKHVLDFVNQQLLSAPAACIVLILVRKQDLRLQPFLAVCAVVPLFFTFIANPDLGAFRDWDILSLPAVPLTLWAVAILLKRVRECENLFRGAFLICGVTALHTLLWVGVNASPAAAEARFTHLLGRLSGHASVNGWLTLAEFYREQDDPSAALDAYERALEADPTNPNRWITVGIICREIGQSQDAIEHFRRAVELRPDSPVPYVNLGAVYNDMAQFGKAIEYTRKAIALQPDLAKAHSNLGAMYRKTGQFFKAVEHLEKVCELQPRDADAHSNLGAVYNDAGQHANAIRALKKAVALRPDDAVAYGNLGAVYSRIGQFDSGIQYLERAVELQPDYTRAHKNLGFVYKIRGRYQEAIGHFEKALELQRESVSASVYLDIGDTYCKLREHEKAIPYFKRAIQLNPNQANAHLLLGMSYRALKRGDQARVHFEKTLELEPDHPQAAQIRQWLEQASEQR